MMKDMNLTRLMDACCVPIDLEVYDDLHDYLMNFDLNEINIDDIYVNSVYYASAEELDEDSIVLTETDNGAWILC
jgi:hypothetical protein